jgi:glutathione S-transferase
MAQELPVLWHFRFSHFSEKVRWALEYKEIEHTKVDWPPGSQVGPAIFRTGQRQLPILCLDESWIHDSAEIIAHLEEKYPHPRLYPEDPKLRQEALDWEDELDTDLGPSTRALILNATLRHPDAVARELAWFKPPLFDLGVRIMTPGLRIAGAAASALAGSTRRRRDTIAEVLDEIEARIEDHDYLVGREFSVADLTAASLLTPIMEVAEYPYTPESGFPSSVESLREEYASRPAIRWAKSVYRRHRPYAGRSSAGEPGNGA